MTRLLLVRHGESTWNAESRWQGQADPPLSPFGERQAQEAAERLPEIATIVAVWTSDLVRARRTGELIAGHLGIDPAREEPRVRERDAGAWTGLTRDEIEARWPGYLAARRAPPDFEDDANLLARARAGLAAIVDAHTSGDVLVVTHGGVVRTVEQSLGAESEPLPNLGGRWLSSAAPAEFTLGERVVLLDAAEVTVPRDVSEQDQVTAESAGPARRSDRTPPA